MLKDQVGADPAVGASADDFEALLSDGADVEPESGEAEPEADEEDTPSDEDASEDAGDQEEGDDEPAPETSYTVKVAGETRKVPLSELLAGYQRNADYTQKTQRLAEERKAHDAEAAATRSERERYSQVLQGLEARMRQMTPEPNWDQLRATDPVGFAMQWADYQRRQGEVAAVQAEQRRIAELNDADRQKQVAALSTQEHAKLLEVLPRWKDPKVASAERRALVEYGLSQGFDADELAGVLDHRAVNMLWKAHQYDRIKARQGDIRRQVAESPTVAAPPSTPARRNRVTQAKTRLAQTGSVRDAAAVFEGMM
jgi:hypothetical protein